MRDLRKTVPTVFILATTIVGYGFSILVTLPLGNGAVHTMETQQQEALSVAQVAVEEIEMFVAEDDAVSIAKTVEVVLEEPAVLAAAPVTKQVFTQAMKEDVFLAPAVSRSSVSRSGSTMAAYRQEQPKTDFKFPESVSIGAQQYLEEAYVQAYIAAKDTVFPDPFMALSLSVVEMPVSQSEVFLIPLVYPDVLNKVLAENDGDFSAAIKYSSIGRDYNKYECVGPLQMAAGWVDTTPRNPTIWLESCQMFYEDSEEAITGITAFAEKCNIAVDDMFLRTVVAMNHNVGWLADWVRYNPDSKPGKPYIPFKSKRAVYQWNAAVASEAAQVVIKQAAYDAYLRYLETGLYENQGVSWKVVADVAGYPRSNVTSTKEWWRPLYSVRFWFNYYQLRLLYGVDTAETLGITTP